jgi:organic hydroperoxide reductase OsmC/OhrA
MKEHLYKVRMTWIGNDGPGTTSYKAYRRDHIYSAEGKPDIPGSSDPHFRGDAARYNPEELLVASLSSCHMLWYLHLCAVDGVVVLEYEDDATGTMQENADGSGQFLHVDLYPRTAISAASDPKKAAELHEKVHDLCFVARSVKFPVHAHPTIKVAKLATK